MALASHLWYPVSVVEEFKKNSRYEPGPIHNEVHTTKQCQDLITDVKGERMNIFADSNPDLRDSTPRTCHYAKAA